MGSLALSRAWAAQRELAEGPGAAQGCKAEAS